MSPPKATFLLIAKSKGNDWPMSPPRATCLTV